MDPYPGCSFYGDEMSTTELLMKFKSDTASAVKGINEINAKLDTFNKSFETGKQKAAAYVSAIKSIALPIVAGVATVKGMVSSFTELTSKYTEQANAEITLQNALKATRGEIGLSQAELYDLANSLSNVTKYSDKTIIGIESLFVSTKKISKEILPDALEATLDVATAMKSDASEAAKKLAQTLSNPAAELEGLKEINIQLTDQQKENIKSVQEQNGIYEAQKLVLEEIQGAYGGVAKAVADVPTGRIDQINNTIEDIKEGLGGALLDAISPALDSIYEKLLLIESWVDKYNDRVSLREGLRSGNADLSGYTDFELAAEIKSLDQLRRRSGGAQRSEAESFIEILEAEIDRRGALYLDGHIIASADNVAKAKASDAVAGAATDINALKTEKLLSKVPNATSEIIIPSIMAADVKSVESSQTAVASQGTDLISSFISSNKALSISAQIDEINAKIREASQYKLEVDPDSEISKQLDEITDGLWAQKEALLSVEEESISLAAAANSALSTYGNAITSLLSNITELYSSLLEQQISTLDDSLTEYDDYFAELDEKYAKQQAALDRYYSAGLISAEDYITASEVLSKEEADAKADAQSEMDAISAESDKLKERQFNAAKINSIAQATIDGASAIANIWAKHAADPVTAGILTGLAVATTSAQIGSIASQNYTPLAAGGIVSKPTMALIGEGASKEAVIPLTDENLERMGLGGSSGVINFYFTINTSGNRDDTTQAIFEAIERAQRTGALPKWSYNR